MITAPHIKGASLGSPTSGYWGLRPQTTRSSDLPSDIWALFPARPQPLGSFLGPARGGARVSGLSSSPTKAPELPGFGRFLSAFPQHTWPCSVSARTWAVLLPRPGKRLGIAPSFPQIWALSPGLPTDWALPPDIGDCPRGLAHLQQRPPPPQSARFAASAPSAPADAASSLQPCGELPAASAAPARLPSRPATVPPGPPLAGRAQEPAEGLRLGGRACCWGHAPRNPRRFRLLFAKLTTVGGRGRGGPQLGRAWRWVAGTPWRGAPRSGGAAPPSPPGRGLGEARAERGRSD